MFEVEGLKVSYGQSEVIHDISFSANKNETLAIMGRNGMGKTTLFKSLMGVLPSDATKVTIDGKEVHGMEL
jgi:urea transport system ATP-binding protein